MKEKTKPQLLPFYFGAIDEKERLLVERELLSDTEYLVDFLDLKRSLEAAQEIPQYPSARLWHRLQPQIASRRKVIISFSFGLAACLVLLFAVLHMGNGKKYPDEILFDAGSELPASSFVI